MRPAPCRALANDIPTQRKVLEYSIAQQRETKGKKRETRNVAVRQQWLDDTAL